MRAKVRVHVTQKLQREKGGNAVDACVNLNNTNVQKINEEEKKYIKNRIIECKKNGVMDNQIKLIETCCIKNYNRTGFDEMTKAAEYGLSDQQIMFVSVLSLKHKKCVVDEVIRYFVLGFKVNEIKTIMEQCNNSAYRLKFMREKMSDEENGQVSDEVITSFITKINNLFTEIKNDRDYYKNVLEKMPEIILGKGKEYKELKQMLDEMTCRGLDTVEAEKKVKKKEEEFGKLKIEYEKYKALYEDSEKRFKNLNKEYGILSEERKGEEKMTEEQLNMLFKAFEEKNNEVIKVYESLADLKDKLGRMEIAFTQVSTENLLLKRKPSIFSLFTGTKYKTSKTKASDEIEGNENVSESDTNYNEVTERKILLKKMINKNFDTSKMEVITSGLKVGLSAESLIELIDDNDLSCEELKMAISILSGKDIKESINPEDKERETDRDNNLEEDDEVYEDDENIYVED